MDFHHGESFQVHTGAALLQPANHFQEVPERQIGMQTANDVELRRAFANALFGALIDFFESEGISAGRIRIAAKRTKFAVRYADVGRIDVTIDVEVGDVAVFFLANVIGEPSDGEKIR